MPNMDVAIMKFCRAERGHPSLYTAEELRAIRLKLSSPLGKVAAIASAGVSVIKTEYLGIRVPLPVIQENEQVCRTSGCGSFVITADQEPACTDCGCAGHVYLRSKWANPESMCPKVNPQTGQRYWTNRRRPRT